ncbi:MAG: SDR family oxidoreductase [Oligoflexia bacterium]|nr:SDR family oxidoreductase [Oligoflexia bacterium]
MRDLFNLDSKTIIITGATGLLGTKHVEAVAEFGAIPIVLDIDQKKIDQLVNRIRSEYDVACYGYFTDVTNEIEVRDVCQTIAKKLGKIDCLINNAANNPKIEDSDNINFTRLENFKLETWNTDVAVGLTGAFLCAKHFGSEIAKNPSGGTIINISSDLGLISPDQRLYRNDFVENHLQNTKPVSYSVVKSGLLGLTKYLATYWADANVRCNAICPGGIMNNQDEDFLKRLHNLIPLGRMAKQDEYKGIIVFLASNAAAYVNGAVISIDGGRTVW